MHGLRNKKKKPMFYTEAVIKKRTVFEDDCGERNAI